MKVGDYVRFKTLSREIKIGKVIEIVEPDNSNEFGPKKCNVYDLDNNEATVDDYIIGKPSSEIKDLIQVGDYVNGEKITRIVPPDLCGDEELTDKKVYINDFEVYEEWIKSIVTKEQFSQMEYRIGE